jgi:heptosyltransferase-1
MHVLIVKTSSMGDVIHTLPALTDAGKAIPGISFDWLVEPNFAEIPTWHPLVKQVIPVSLRHWRKNLLARTTWQEWQAFRQLLRAKQYDLIIDAQGLLKSVWLALNARGKRCGFSFSAARDLLAAFFYQEKIVTAKVKEEHAVVRLRDLFSQALHYPLPKTMPDYGITRERFQLSPPSEKYIVFLHGTTWTTKHWPEEYWIELAKKVNENGLLIKLPWGNATEQARAERIAANCNHVEILPRLDLLGMANVLASAQAIVAVDTGLGHLAAALNVPTVSLYGPTNPVLTGALGQSQKHLTAKFSCAPCLSRECSYRGEETYSPLNPSPLYPVRPPCFTLLPPALVWSELSALLLSPKSIFLPFIFPRS